MNKKNIMSFAKKLTAGVLAVGMIAAGIVIAPKQAEAAVVDDVVVYEELDIATYWNDIKKAPIKEGYVFGGWFKEATDETEYEVLTSSLDVNTTMNCVPLTETKIDADGDGKVDEGVTAVAKFVPAQVLSVKAQNEKKVTADYIANLNPEGTAEEAKDSFWVRVMTSLDSKNYKSVGFDIYLANIKKVTKADGTACETTKAYSQLYVGETLTSASAIFGGASQYACVWKLDSIDTASNADKIIYVRPYWNTMDGTKVLGLAKYVHIEDEYEGYISVPINLQSAKEIAAGTVNMSYDYTGLELISTDETKYFEAGRILPNMQFNHDTTNKTFSMIGNVADVDNYNSTESIYANIRFKKPTNSTGSNLNLNFDMTLGEFCDWGENTVENNNVKVWDIAYEVKATTNE